jgi:hypothetical protein
MKTRFLTAEQVINLSLRIDKARVGTPLLET